MISSDARLCEDCRDDCGEVVEATGYVAVNGREIWVCSTHAHDYDFEEGPEPRRKPIKVDQSRYVSPWPMTETMVKAKAERERKW